MLTRNTTRPLAGVYFTALPSRLTSTVAILSLSISGSGIFSGSATSNVSRFSSTCGRILCQHFVEHPAQVGHLLVERQRAKFHAADAEQIVHEPRQPRRFGIDRVEKLLLLLDVDHVGQRQRFGVGLDIRQRRPQLVRRRVDELVAHFLGQLLLRDVANGPDVALLLAAARRCKSDDGPRARCGAGRSLRGSVR